MRVTLEIPSRRPRKEFLAAARRSRGLHHPWLAPPGTPAKFEDYLKRLKLSSNVGFWVRVESGELAGVININGIIRGSFHSGYLGYYAFQPYTRLGYMTEGLRAVISRAFGKLRLHRLEANIQPDNEPSRRLVQGLGFRLEGFSPRYLKVTGRWRDHERWAITVEDWNRLNKRQ